MELRILGAHNLESRTTRFESQRVIVSHMSPLWESAIRRELETLKAALGIEIVVSAAD